MAASHAASSPRQCAIPVSYTHLDVYKRQARALVGIFLNDQYVKGKAKKLTKDVETPKRAAVLGAGIMGGGIAYQLDHLQQELSS